MTSPAYPPSPPATPTSARPTAVMILAIIGIVFGGLGLLCGGLGLVSAVVGRFIKTNLSAAPQGQAIPIALAIVAFALSAVLLIASIGSLSLNVQSRKLMVYWAVADIIYDTAKLGTTITFVVPTITRTLSASNPGNVTFVREMVIVGGIVVWLFTVVYAGIVWFVFRSKNVTAAFERGSVGFEPLMPAMPLMSPPPPPGSY